MRRRRNVFAIATGTVLALSACSREEGAETGGSEAAPTATGAPAVDARGLGCAGNFERFDADGDGRVSKTEFLSWPHARGNPEAVFASRDGDGDGELVAGEFCSGWQGPPRGAMGPGMDRGPHMKRGMGRGGPRGMGRGGGPGPMGGMHCHQHFTTFDADADGQITLEEFSAWPHVHGDAATLFAARDGDGDGAITESELCAGWSASAK